MQREREKEREKREKEKEREKERMVILKQSAAQSGGSDLLLLCVERWLVYGNGNEIPKEMQRNYTNNMQRVGKGLSLAS